MKEFPIVRLNLGIRAWGMSCDEVHGGGGGGGDGAASEMAGAEGRRNGEVVVGQS
jgi:hypothetical protein